MSAGSWGAKTVWTQECSCFLGQNPLECMRKGRHLRLGNELSGLGLGQMGEQVDAGG